MELAKKVNVTIYLGTFDISKAFDTVSRYRLLLALVELGVDSVMLQAIKQLYNITKCSINFFGKLSPEFYTYCGIRQGSASSCILFVIYMDKIVSYMSTKCIAEPLIGTLNVLLHADDTVVISTSRENFIYKCSLLFEYFDNENLQLNMSKSSYMIFNANTNDVKNDLVIRNRILPYKSNQIYLGSLISDNNNISIGLL